MTDTNQVDEAVDVVVLGMGPGGEDAAGRLAEAGLDVIAVEAELVGGECPYWGCVPSKMMVRAANLLAEARRIPDLAGRSTVHPDWSQVAARIRDEATDHWDDHAAVERFEGKGGRLVRGRGRITGAGTVAVGDLRIRAARGIVVATGTSTAVPPIDGLDEVPYWTNREAIATEELPDSLLVLGGGAIGVELGQVFSRFGVAVTIVEAGDRLVADDEPEAGRILGQVLEAEGVRIRMDADVTRAHRDGASVALELADGDTLTADQLLVVTGRRADLAATGVGAVGIDDSQRFLPVDGHLRAAEGVWALGDVTGKGQFTHVAMYQSRIAVADILGRPGPAADYRAVPHVTFTDPEIAGVGMTEAAAREAEIDVRIGVAQVPDTTRGWIHNAGNDGLIKLVVDSGRGILVGATAVGPSGGEVIGMLTLAVHAEIPIEELRRMIYAYPTFHRGIEQALEELSDSVTR